MSTAVLLAGRHPDPSPPPSPRPAPAGIRCADGTTSTATGRQGACSRHGGIATPERTTP
jgi:hypothetical protein